ncbi:MAG: PEGA domain-containing protein [Caldisericaceae bacterium]
MKKGLLFILVLFSIVLITVALLQLTNQKTGSITIDSFPKKASVYLDGEFKGETPISIKNLTFKKYTVRISFENYKDYVEDVTLTGNNPKTIIYAILEHKTFSINVSSDPENANVYLDGILKGKTPLVITDIVQSEKHILEIKLDNYETFKEEVNEEKNNIFAKLIPITTHLIVTSVPSNADVFINDAFVGKTPFEQKNLEEGNYNIKVKMPNYRTFQGMVTLEKGKTVEVNVALEKTDVYVSINSNPQGTNVYVDGLLMGKTPIELTELSEGEHILKLDLDGYLPYETVFNVVKNNQVILNINLLKLP